MPRDTGLGQGSAYHSQIAGQGVIPQRLIPSLCAPHPHWHTAGLQVTDAPCPARARSGTPAQVQGWGGLLPRPHTGDLGLRGLLGYTTQPLPLPVSPAFSHPR